MVTCSSTGINKKFKQHALECYTVNVLKFQTFYSLLFLAKILLFMQLVLKILSEMANSSDSDQTAPSGAVWSGSEQFAYAILPENLVYKILGHLP